MKNFKSLRNVFVITAVLVGTGYLRMPVEQEFTEDLRERKIVQPQISAQTWSQMGQTSLAGAFGGLRSVMASMLSLKAQGNFEENEWYDLKKDYEVITALDPYNEFYWTHGGWHIGYNAASWARSNRDFSPAKRRIMEFDFIEAGDAFYRKGLDYLPDSRTLQFEIGALWSNKYKRPDLERAAEAFKMVRREAEAYEEAIRLISESSRHARLPTFRCLLVVLGTNPELPQSILNPTIDDVFPNKEKAYQDLYNYRQRVLEENFYAGEVDRILKELIDELNVPDNLNPFVTPTTRRIHEGARNILTI